jgi:hypothetical protein
LLRQGEYPLNQAAGKLDQAMPLFQQAAAGIEKRRFRNLYAGQIVNNIW